MSFTTGCLTEGNASLSLLCQLPNGSVWGATSEGRLAHFSDDSFDVSFLQTRPDAYLEVLPDRLLAPRHPLGFSVSLLDVHDSGLKAIVAGYAGNRPHLAVADLQQGTDSKGQLEYYTYSYCEGDFIFNRAGMKLQQVSWWPETVLPSFVVLAGNILAVYQSSSVSVPLATYRLQFSPVYYPSTITDCGNATAFCFVENAKDWGAFTVCILRDDGAVFVLCPVVVSGFPFGTSDAIKLLKDETPEITKRWHHQVFSRTQLQGSVGRAHGDEGNFIYTRNLRDGWKYAPALQGPLCVRRHLQERDFHSIVSMNGGSLALANIRGTVILASISSILPVFHDKEMRSGAPHVFLLQDCVRTPSDIRIEQLSETRMPDHESTTVQFLKTQGHSYLIAKTDGYTAQLDCSDPSAPKSALQQNVPGSLGCIIRGPFVLSVLVAGHFELKCAFLQKQQYSVYRSRLHSGVEEVQEKTDVALESEEDTLEKIFSLQEFLKTAFEKEDAFCRGQEQTVGDTSTKISQLRDGISELVAGAVASVERRGKESLSQKYKDVLNEICSEVEALDPSAMNSPSRLQHIKDCLRDLGS